MFLRAAAVILLGLTIMAYAEEPREPSRFADVCELSRLEPVQIIMDRVCIFCHDLFGNRHANLRSKCRDHCYDNDTFRQCVEIFSVPKKDRGNN